MKKWEYPCSYVYDPAVGDKDNGVPAGTAGKTCRKTRSGLSAVQIRLPSKKLTKSHHKAHDQN